MISIDSNKQQALDANLQAIQQINFTGNLDQAGKTTMIFLTEEGKETSLNLSDQAGKITMIFLTEEGKETSLNFSEGNLKAL